MERMSTLCYECGTNNEEDSIYCGSCGSRLGPKHRNFSPAIGQFGNLTRFRAISQSVLENFRLVKAKIVPETYRLIFRMQLIVLRELRLPRPIRQGVTEITDRAAASIRSLAGTSRPHLPAESAKKLENPAKEISKTTNKLSPLDRFSSLPLWFTMPLIFACSFSFGAIVMLLVRGL